ncbi:MAG TPA: hypothetical protein VH583_03935 [Vicinamibacterales bacterium]|jgi:hypothetical protein
MTSDGWNMSAFATAHGRGVGAAVVALLLFAAAGCHAPTSPSKAAGSVDVLDYVLGAAESWPRVGSQSQNQVVEDARREVCWVKYANPRTFECWRWDDQFIYHVVDHAIDGNTGESYQFDDGRWLPRRLNGEWNLDVTTHITWFDPACRVIAERSGPARYHQRAWIEPARDLGGDLGVRSVLVLEYSPQSAGGGPSSAERFSFGRGVGWFEWARGDTVRTFARIGGPAMPVAQDVRCR